MVSIQQHLTHISLASFCCFQMELWRADIATSVFQLDHLGNVTAPELPEVGALYPGWLITGLQDYQLLDKHISMFIPELEDRPLSDVMMPGVFGEMTTNVPVAKTGFQSKRGGMKRSTGTCPRLHSNAVTHCCIGVGIVSYYSFWLQSKSRSSCCHIILNGCNCNILQPTTCCSH
jgi:hypothetical protein